jgi:hypothetical protein
LSKLKVTEKYSRSSTILFIIYLLIIVGFSRANEEIQAFKRENADLKKQLDELKEMTDQAKRKKPVSLSHVQDEEKSALKGKSYCFNYSESYSKLLSIHPCSVVEPGPNPDKDPNVSQFFLSPGSRCGSILGMRIWIQKP